MSDITVIGLGSMGAALARALHEAGHKVTVWNRSPAKAEPLVSLGMTGAAAVADAVKASPRVLVCIDDYPATKSLLGAKGVAQSLSGRTLIQLSTGTPAEARDMQAWAKSLGADYLDGAIMVYPRFIGTVNAMIMYAGDEAVFESAGPCLRAFGGDVHFVGRDPGAAAACDMALLSALIANAIGVAHGALICESEGVNTDTLASVVGAMDLCRVSHVIRDDSFEKCDAALQTWSKALERIRRQARDRGINGDVPDFMARLFAQAKDAGLGNQDIAAIFKVLRAHPAT